MDQERLGQEKLSNEAPHIGIALELFKNKAIVLTSSGDLFQIKKKLDLKIGDKIYFFEEDIKKEEFVSIKNENNLVDLNERQKARKKIMAKGSAWTKLIASIAAVIMIFYIASMPKTISAYALMSIDINPSINLTIDKVGNVIKAKALNVDADKVLKGLRLEGRNYSDALADIFSSLIKNGYDINTRDILIAVAPLMKEGAELATKISDDVVKKSGSQTVQIVKGDLSDGDSAEKSDVSLGRKLIEKENPEIEEKEIEHMPVKDLFKIVPKKIRVQENESDENTLDEQSNDNEIHDESNDENENVTNNKSEKNNQTDSNKKIDKEKENKSDNNNDEKKNDEKKNDGKNNSDKKNDEHNNDEQNQEED